VVKPSAILNIIEAAETMRFKSGSKDSMPQPGKCERCGYISSQKVCKACLLLDGLNRGLPGLGVGRTRLPPRPGNLKSLGRESDADGGSIQNNQVKPPRTHLQPITVEYEPA
jgi:cytoplasmic tRNA 2-thiolation protein 1